MTKNVAAWFREIVVSFDRDVEEHMLLESEPAHEWPREIDMSLDALTASADIMDCYGAALEKVRRLSLNADGYTFDLILSIADGALQNAKIVSDIALTREGAL